MVGLTGPQVSTYSIQSPMNRVRRLSSFKVAALIATMLLGGVPSLYAQKGAQSGSGAESGQAAQGNGVQQPSAQQSSGAAAANNGQGGSGSSGTEPIEVSLLAYRSLGAMGRVIAAALSTTLPEQTDTIVVVSPSDLSAILEWRAVIGQLEFLQKRLDLDESLYNDLAEYNLPGEIHPIVTQNPGGAKSLTITDFSSLVQAIPTLASTFAVNEASVSSQGSIVDEPLMATVAGNLRGSGWIVYVPAVYTPNLMTGADLGDGVLSDRLSKLEASRKVCGQRIQSVVKQLGEASMVVQKRSKYKPADQQIAARYLADSLEAKAFVASCTADIQAMDMLEGTLFSGQTQTAQVAGSSGGPSNAAGGSPAPSSQQVPQTGGPASSGQPLQTSVWSSPGTTLQAVVSADLLMRSLLGPSNGVPNAANLSKFFVLSIRVLDSGGEELSRSNIFGTKIRFGGGVAATFSLYKLDGTIRCSGIVVAYRGDVSNNDVQAVVQSSPAPSHMPFISPGACQVGATKSQSKEN